MSAGGRTAGDAPPSPEADAPADASPAGTGPPSRPRWRSAAPGSWSTRGLFLLALLWALHAAAALLFPIVLALLLALLLKGPVETLARFRIPKAIGAALLLVLGLGAVGFGVARLREPALDWLAEAPRTLERVERRVRDVRGRVEQASRAAEEVEKITAVGEEPKAEVTIEEPGLVETVMGALPALVGGAVVAVVLLYLLLVYDEELLASAVRVVPELERKRRVVNVARRSQEHVSRYLLTITTINFGLGVAVAVALAMAGVPNPWLWGLLAGLLNYVPYLGAVVGVAIVTLVSLVSLDELGRALAGPAAYAILNSLEGMLITPIVLGQRFSLNPVIIFVWLLLWGWLWGIGGALIAIPLLTAFKILCDEVPGLRPVGELLGR